MKKIAEMICKRKGLFIFLLIILTIFMFLFCPRRYKTLLRQAELKEVEELEVYFGYIGRDKHESIITDKYLSYYLITDKETIKHVQEVFQSISLKPRYRERRLAGLYWNVNLSGQGDYILSVSGGLLEGNYGYDLDNSLMDKKTHASGDKKLLLSDYEISEEDNEKIIKVLFEAINENIKDMTIQDAIRLSEENAEWRKFMYYFMTWGERSDTNQLYIPIANTDMKIEICYQRIITEPEYIEPIEKAVLHDKEGNEYEYFSEEAREILRREVGE